MLLAWDTSTDVVTVSLHDGSTPVGHRRGAAARRHAEVLVPLVGELLAEADVAGADLAGVLVGVGPGAYTGLRVGLVTAQALGLTWGVPVRGACSLDAIAVQAVAEQPSRCADGVLVVADARRRQVFWAQYNASGARLAGPQVGPPEAVPHGGLPVVGGGGKAYRDRFGDVREPTHPDAGWLAQGVVSGVITPQPVVPMYLRQPDVTVSGGAKTVLQAGSSR